MERLASPMTSRRNLLLAGGTALLPVQRARASIAAPPLSVVTGANTGIGFEVARGLADAGFDVVLACRTTDKARGAALRLSEQALSEQASGRFIVLDTPLDLASLDSVSSFADALLRLDRPVARLVLNAGISACASSVQRVSEKVQLLMPCCAAVAVPQSLSSNGHELHFAVNHLGHYLLTSCLLAGGVLAEPGARVVSVSSLAAYSGAHVDDLDWERRPYERWGAYGASKCCNVLFADELADQNPSLQCSSVHPGIVDTDLIRYVAPGLVAQRAANPASASSTAAHAFGLRTPAQGAAPVLWAAVSNEAGRAASGTFWLDERSSAPELLRPGGGDGGRAQRHALWERSEAFVKGARGGRRAAAAAAAAAA